MDNDMLGKIGRGFWNDGIFGAVRSAFGIDQQRQTRTMANKNGPGVGRLVPEDPRVKRLVIDDSGIEGFEVEPIWLDYFRKVQPFTMSRERPTLRDLVSDIVALELATGDLDDLREIVNTIVRELGAEKPFMVLLDMRMTVKEDKDEPEISVVLTDAEVNVLRTAAAYAMGCEMTGRPLLLDAFELDYMDRSDQIAALYKFSLALPAGGGRLVARGIGFIGLCIVWRVLMQHASCRTDGPLVKFSLGKAGTFNYFFPHSPVLGSFSPLDLFISRDRAQVTLLHDVVTKLGNLMGNYLEGAGSAAWQRWRERQVAGHDFYIMDMDSLPAPLELFRGFISRAAKKIKKNLPKGKRDPTLLELINAVNSDSRLGERDREQWLEIVADLASYLMLDKNMNSNLAKALESVTVDLYSFE